MLLLILWDGENTSAQAELGLGTSRARTEQKARPRPRDVNTRRSCYYSDTSCRNMTPTEQTVETGLAPMPPAPRKPVAAFSAFTSSTRLPALDGIRGVAILLVLLCHAVFQMNPESRILKQALVLGRLTWSGVDLFFVLSGFLIGGILLDARDSPSYFKTFYARRAYRILPLYGVMVALFSIRFVPVHWIPHWLGTFSAGPIPWLSYVTFTQNIWMAMYGTFGVGTMAGTWSLAVEEQFYLTAPLLVRKISRQRLAWVLVAIVMGAPLFRALIISTLKYGHFANYVLMPSRADALSVGVLAALMVRSSRALKWLLANRSRLYAIASVLFVGLAWLTYVGYDPDAGRMVTLGYTCLALFYVCFLLIGVTHGGGHIQRFLCSKWLMDLGVVAYFTYLVHLPMMEACRRALGIWFRYSAVTTQFWGGVIGVFVTLVLAKFSWNYFEKPLLRRGHAYHY